MTKYDIRIEGEGHVGSVDAVDERHAVKLAEDFIASGEYDLGKGELLSVRYWLTAEGQEQGDSRTIELEG